MHKDNPYPEYNYDRAKVSHYNFDVFTGPAAGEHFKDFSFTDLETEKTVRLSDFRGRWVVLETASSTCSMYTKNIDDMKGVMAKFPDVEFLIIYVREAHPGERLRGHRSLEDKLRAARLLAPRYGEYRRILVDNLEGDFHRAYGGMPNILYILRPDGTIHYRCNWAAPREILKALEDRNTYHTWENADMKTLKAARKKFHMIRTMWTGGFIALWDFIVATPGVIKRHKMIDQYYKKHQKFKQRP